jgi:HPt (histidine-containing phosphotransfer) domain-containing protein
VPDEVVLDPAVVADLRRAQEAYGNPAFIEQLVALFREHAPRKMAALRAAAASRDAAGIEGVAHTLKTNCGMLGATRMADACGRLEAAAARADFDAAATALRDAESLLPCVLAALAKL